MATVVRIKRRLDEEPTDNIVIKAKRSRGETESSTQVDNEESALLTRVGTVESKKDPLEPLIRRAVKKGGELRESYKRLGGNVSYKGKAQLEAKYRAINKRYTIFSQNRGIDASEPCESVESPETSNNQKLPSAKEGKDVEGAAALPSADFAEAEFSCIDAEVAQEEDVITCNGVPMESEKYVYDIFYSQQPVNLEKVSGPKDCRIEIFGVTSFPESESDSDDLEDDDDENEEGNWRNDYPDYDDSPYEDEESYLNSQLRKYSKKEYDSDESYNMSDYEEESFDHDGNLIMTTPQVMSLIKRMKLKDSEDDSDSDG